MTESSSRKPVKMFKNSAEMLLRLAGAWSAVLALWTRLKAMTQVVKAAPKAKPVNRAGRSSELARPAVRPRPLSLEDRYRPMVETRDLDDIFLRLRQNLYGAADDLVAMHEPLRQSRRGPVQRRDLSPAATAVNRQAGPAKVILREAGRLGGQRAYFYLKPLNETGWLFERSGAGWVVSRAEKIVGRDTFLRQGEPWDIVSLHEAVDGQGTIRVNSRRVGAELVPFSVYETKLNEAIFDSFF